MQRAAALRSSLRTQAWTVALALLVGGTALLLLLPSGSFTAGLSAETALSLPSPGGHAVGSPEGALASSSASTLGASDASSLPIGVAAGEVAATLAPWANYTTTGYHKVSGDPETQGPLVYDPLDHDFWVGGNSENYYNVPDPVLLVNATTLQPAGIVPSVTNAGPMVFDAANGIMYISEVEGSTVLQVNALTGTSAGPALVVGQTPGPLALNPYQDLLYVANTENDSLEAVSLATGTVVAYSATLGPTYDYPGGPTWDGLAYDATAHCVVTALSNNDYVDWLNGTTLYNRTGYHVGGFGGLLYTITVDPAGNVWAMSWIYPDTDVDVVNLTHVIATTSTSYGVMDALYVSSLGMVVSANPYFDSLNFFSPTNDSYVSSYYFTNDFGPSNLVTRPGSTSLYSLSADTLVYPYSSGCCPEDWGSDVVAISPSTGAITQSSPHLEGNPASLVYDPDANAVVSADAFSQNLTFISATDPLGLPDRTVYYNGSAGAPAYDPLSRTIWLPLELSTVVGFVGQTWTPGDVLQVLNASTGAPEQTILPWGQDVEVEVTWAGYDAALGTMAVIGVSWNDGDGFLAEFNARTGAPVGTVVDLGDIGYGNTVPNAVIDPIGNQVIVAPGTDDVLYAVSLTSLTVTSTITVGDEPFGLAFDSADGTIYVSNTENYNLTLVNGTTDQVVVPAVDLDGEPTYVAYDPSTELVYVGVERAQGATPSNLETTLVVLNGSSVPAVWGQWPTIYTGYSAPIAPEMAIFVPSDVVGTPGEIWNSNTYDGSITVISVPPAVTSFWASPDDLEVGEPLVLTATAIGGADGVTPSYAGLPPGCTSAPTWTISCTPTASGTFVVTLTVTDGIGLVATQSLALTIAPPLQVPGTLTPGVIDVGQTVWGNVTPDDGVPPYAVTWSFGDGSPGGTGDDVSHAFTTPGVYEVRANVTDALGLLGSFGGAVQVNPSPALAINAASTTATEGVSDAFAATLSGGTVPYGAVSWNFGDGSPAASGDFASHTFTKVGAFTVTASVTDARGVPVSATETVLVSVSSSLALSLTLGANLTSSGTPVSLVAEASGGVAPYTYAWTVDGLPAGTDSDTYTFTPPGTGTYTLSVTVTDASGATATRGTTLSVQNPSTTTSASPVQEGAFAGLGILVGILVGLLLGFFLARRRKESKEKLGAKGEHTGPSAATLAASEDDHLAPTPGEESADGSEPPAVPAPTEEGKLSPIPKDGGPGA